MSAPEMATTASQQIVLGRHDELKKRQRMVIDVDGVGIGIYFVGDEVRAYLNICPHMGGPVCQGKIMPRTLEQVADNGKSLGLGFSKEQLHIVCPWHGFEFDMLTGRHPIDPSVGLTPIPVQVTNGEVVVTVGGPRA
ncbi:Rieske 2Fe-2S domain-containing protein [Aminobacter sp. AP02]|uniref:Rieske (2Fe-2S) protein n=1 Tax=Aminobacter sp. AP02 TaxID=2135737 RepID=UPI000D7A71CB|nr:Rieske 2Fe-2S domain-containing protein [Aminobacter sp. AP02]PWK76733.1 nitrite reductase/ring-hydroxylating ferredoxin subunit [Aminobacter sp. AP02]